MLELSSRGWRGVVMTRKTVAEIEPIRRQQHAATTDYTEEVLAAQHPHQRTLRPANFTRET